MKTHFWACLEAFTKVIKEINPTLIVASAVLQVRALVG